MAEYKQYIIQNQAKGSVMISEDVVSTIVERAVMDVEGVAGLSTMPGRDIVDMLGVNWGKAVRIFIAEDNSLTIHCNIVVAYGNSVVDVADAVRTAIPATVENMTGVKVAQMNVNVCGIACK